MKTTLLSALLILSVSCFSQMISSHKLIGVWGNADSLYNNYTISFLDTVNAIVVGENNGYKATYTLKYLNSKTLLTIKGNKKFPSLKNTVVKVHKLHFIIDSVSDNTLKLELLDDKASILGCSTLTRRFVAR